MGTPEQPEFIRKSRDYIIRPISAHRYRNRLKVNRILCNTEIDIIEENSNKFDNDSFSSSDNDIKYKYYNETSVDNLSDVSQINADFEALKNNVLIQRRVEKDVQMARRKSAFKEKIIIFNSTRFENSDSDYEKELQLDGDYIIRKALLKDHNIGDLANKEMKFCLNICCKNHAGSDEMGCKILEVYRKPEVKEISEEEVNTIVIQFLRNLRKEQTYKKILDLIDDIQSQLVKILPFGSMMRIMYKLENDADKNRDVWFVPNREEAYSGMVKIHNFMDYFMETTDGNSPILIKDIFDSNGFRDDKVFAVNVNGN